MPDGFFVGIQRRFRRFSGAKSRNLCEDSSKKGAGTWAGDLIRGSLNNRGQQETDHHQDQVRQQHAGVLFLRIQFIKGHDLIINMIRHISCQEWGSFLLIRGSFAWGIFIPSSRSQASTAANAKTNPSSSDRLEKELSVPPAGRKK